MNYILSNSLFSVASRIVLIIFIITSCTKAKATLLNTEEINFIIQHCVEKNGISEDLLKNTFLPEILSDVTLSEEFISLNIDYECLRMQFKTLTAKYEDDLIKLRPFLIQHIMNIS